MRIMFVLKAKLIKFGFLFVILFASLNLIYNYRENEKVLRNKLSAQNLLGRTANNTQSDYIFIGGYGRSGTTLMRAILDVHPSIKCGPETKIIPPFVNFASTWRKRTKHLDLDLVNAGINASIVDSAIVNFISYVMTNRGFSAKRLCAKDPDIILYMEYIHSILPKAKFIYMVRDGRAAAYSLMLQIKERLSLSVYKSYLSTWASFNRIASRTCDTLGPNYCLLVKYEDLVLHPERTLKRVLNYLGENWTDKLLKHHEHIGDEIQISKTEWSSHQIIKPINTEPLTQWLSWVNKMNLKESDINFIEPMLKHFNYDIKLTEKSMISNQPDVLVVENNKLIIHNKQLYDNMALNVSEHISNLQKKILNTRKFQI